MKLLRFTLACSLLLLAASPSFALACKSCDGVEPTYCISTPDSGTRCQFSPRLCITIQRVLHRLHGVTPAPAVLAEWTVASIEVSRPAEGTKVVTSPTAVAEAGVSPSAAQK